MALLGDADAKAALFARLSEWVLPATAQLFGKKVKDKSHHLDFDSASIFAQIDAFVASTLQELHCKSAFLNYTVREHPPFPSHACRSEPWSSKADPDVVNISATLRESLARAGFTQL